jgi:hypothetical protein
MVIYRVAHNDPSNLVSAECTAAARTSLREHTTCIALLASYDLDPALFELWIYGGVILFPFLPFNIVFCSVIETGNLADLESLKALVDGLELLSRNPDYTLCVKQLGIFRALYTLAVVHKEARDQSQLGLHPPSSGPGSLEDAALERFPSTSTKLPLSNDQDETWNEGPDLPPVPHIRDSQSWIDFVGMGLDPLGTQLAYWIQESSQGFDNFSGT